MDCFGFLQNLAKTVNGIESPLKSSLREAKPRGNPKSYLSLRIPLGLWQSKKNNRNILISSLRDLTKSKSWQPIVFLESLDSAK